MRLAGGSRLGVGRAVLVLGMVGLASASTDSSESVSNAASPAETETAKTEPAHTEPAKTGHDEQGANAPRHPLSLEPADTALRTGNYADAADLYAKILDRSAEDRAALEGRVHALLLEDRWPQALDEAHRHHEKSPDDPICTTVLAEVLLRAGLLEEASTILGPLAAESALPAHGLMTLARLKSAAGVRNEAAQLMDRALALSPDDREMLLHSYSVALDRPEAIRRLARFLELSEGADPDRVLAARESIAMLETLGDRQLWQQKTHPERLELKLNRVMTMNGRRLGYAIDGRFGARGKPVRLLLDTGADGLHLVSRIAKKNGFAPLAASTLFGGGGDQRHASERGTFETLDIGGLEFAEVLASASPVELESTGRFHGLIGISAFAGYRVTLDLKAGRLLLEPPEPPIDGSKYWVFNGQMLVRAGTTSGDSGLFLFDSGAATTVLSRRFVEGSAGASLLEDGKIEAFGGTVAGSQIAKGLRVVFDGKESNLNTYGVLDLSVRSRLGGVEISGFLGLDLLEGTRIVIDTPSQTIKMLEAP